VNPIAAYVFAEVISHSLYRFSTAAGLSWQEVLYQNGFEPFVSPASASLLYAICYVLASWAAMWMLYRKRIFLKI
jgi:predicted acyltransferase